MTPRVTRATFQTGCTDVCFTLGISLLLPCLCVVGTAPQGILLDIESDVKMAGFCLDPRMALVFTLEYDIAEPAAQSPHAGVSAGSAIGRTVSAPSAGHGLDGVYR
jgi:hypothetical protein